MSESVRVPSDVTRADHWRARFLHVGAGEVAAVLWSFAYFFCLLRESLYNVVSRAEKYKAKNFMDTVVYSGGDATSGWLVTGLKSLGAGIAGISFVACRSRRSGPRSESGSRDDKHA